MVKSNRKANKSVRDRCSNYLESDEWNKIVNNIQTKNKQIYKVTTSEELDLYNKYLKERTNIENKILSDKIKNKEKIENKYYRKSRNKKIYNIPIQKELTRKEKYAKYIKTKEWQAISTNMRNNIKICQICGNRENLCVHHLVYENIVYDFIGNEYVSDVSVICNACHDHIHKYHSVLEVIARDEKSKEDFLHMISNNINFGYNSNIIDKLINVFDGRKIRDLYL